MPGCNSYKGLRAFSLSLPRLDIGAQNEVTGTRLRDRRQGFPAALFRSRKLAPPLSFSHPPGPGLCLGFAQQRQPVQSCESLESLEVNVLLINAFDFDNLCTGTGKSSLNLDGLILLLGFY